MPRSTWRILTLVLALVAAVLVPRLMGPHAQAPIRAPSAASALAPGPAAAPVGAHAFGPEVGFRTRAHWMEHFHKHGAELGCTTPEEYLRRAQALRDRPSGGGVLEAVRGDGVVTRFDRASGLFVAYDGDGTLRTCFRPNDGEAYFRRQIEQEHR